MPELELVKVKNLSTVTVIDKALAWLVLQNQADLNGGKISIADLESILDVEGTPGEPGPPGEPGEDGAPGPPGTTLSLLYQGNEAPTNLIGSHLDFYIDWIRWKVYGPRTSGMAEDVWGDGVRMIFRWMGPYTVSVNYLKNDVVSHLGHVYVATEDRTAEPPDPDLAYWDLMVGPGATGPAGPAGPEGPPGDLTTILATITTIEGVLVAYGIRLDAIEAALPLLVGRVEVLEAFQVAAELQLAAHATALADLAAAVDTITTTLADIATWRTATDGLIDSLQDFANDHEVRIVALEGA